MNLETRLSNIENLANSVFADTMHEAKQDYHNKLETIAAMARLATADFLPVIAVLATDVYGDTMHEAKQDYHDNLDRIVALARNVA